MTDEAKALVERFKGHTPGPWAYRDNKIVAVNVKPDWADLDEDYADERISVVDLYGAMGGIDTCADAQLIAAAPEMLDLIETQAREIERLRDACDKADRLADHWFAQYETLRDGLIDILARAALGDSHDQ